MNLIDYITANKKRVLTGVFIFLLTGFIALSLFVVILPPTFIDVHISQELQEQNGNLLSDFMKFVSQFGNMPVSLILVLLTSLLFLFARYRREALFTFLTLSSGLVSSVLKICINRPRPTKDLVTIMEITRQQSFPSGHTLFYTVFFGFLIIVMGNKKGMYKPLRIGVSLIAAAMVFLGPLSRVYLGAHWFTDVLGGFVLGLLCLFLIGYFYLRQSNKEDAL
jgi:membrane-associated phospholipid phosphatase